MFILCTMLVTVANMECQQIKNKLHSCDRFVRTSEKYSDLMEMTFDDEEEEFLVTFFLANQPPKVNRDIGSCKRKKCTNVFTFAIFRQKLYKHNSRFCTLPHLIAPRRKELLYPWCVTTQIHLERMSKVKRFALALIFTLGTFWV